MVLHQQHVIYSTAARHLLFLFYLQVLQVWAETEICLFKDDASIKTQTKHYHQGTIPVGI
jgi:hypothetical protein